MRTFATLQVLCTLDLDQVQEAFNQQVTFDDTDSTTSSQVQSGIVTLSPSETSLEFQFGSVDAASTVLVVAYDAVQVQLGSNAAPLVDIRPVPASSAASIASVYQRSAQPGVLFIRGRVSSMFVTNPSSTSAARAFVAVVGDAT